MNRRERNLLILLGVLVLAAGGFFLLTRGGGDDEEQTAATAPAAPAPPAAAAPGVPAEGEAENPLEEPPKVFRFFGGRDPFVQLVVAEAGASGAETAAATTGEAPPAPPAPVEPAPVGAEEDAQGEAVTVDQKRVELVDVVDEDTAQVEVATEEFKVNEGDRFAKYFELVSVDATCTRLLFGDVSFVLCEGGAR
jgi:hypothetical protein